MVKRLPSKVRVSQAGLASRVVGSKAFGCGSDWPQPRRSSASAAARLERIAAIADQAGAGGEGAGVRQQEDDLGGDLVGIREAGEGGGGGAHRLEGGLLASRRSDEIGEEGELGPDPRRYAAGGDGVDPDDDWSA